MANKNNTEMLVEKTAFLINTYNRHESIVRLVQSIRRIHPNHHIYIVDDGSVPHVMEFRFFPYIFVRHQQHKGKQLYWQTCNELFDMVKGKDYDWYVMLPDDVTVAPDFLDKAIAKWNEISDPKLIGLNLIRDREGLACWTGFLPVEKEHATLTQWLDMCFICQRRMLSQVLPIPSVKMNWKDYPMRGSGVGAYISRTLHAKGWHMYQVKESLVSLQESHKESRMNPYVEIKQKSDDIL